MMELLKEKDEYAPAFLPVHKTARMVDDRYNITKEEQEKIIKKYFPEGTNHSLVKFPPREKQRLVVLREIVKRLEVECIYTEKELNEILKSAAACVDFKQAAFVLPILYSFTNPPRSLLMPNSK